MPDPNPSPPVPSRIIGADDLVAELDRCGWKRAGISGGDDLRIQSGRGEIRPVVTALRSAADHSLLVMDFGDFMLPGRDELYPRYLDFPMETRLAFEAARALDSPGLLLILTAGRAELFECALEHAEVSVSSELSLEDELLPALAARARARGRSLETLPNHLESANALRGWVKHWSREFSERVGTEFADCEKFVWKIILMLQASRKSPGIGARLRWGVTIDRARGTGEGAALAYDPLSTHEDLARVLEEFDRTFSTRIFTGDAELHRSWLERIEETTLAEQFRAELLMQSASRFAAESVAWLFTDIEREQEGWRREISGRGPLHKHFHNQGWLVLKPLECDVGRFGLAAALREADRLADYWNDFDVYQSRQPRAPEAGPVMQPDLFVEPPRGVGPRNRLTDGVNFMFANSLRLTGVADSERFGTGLVFLLKALDWSGRLGWTFRGVDTADHLFEGDS